MIIRRGTETIGGNSNQPGRNRRFTPRTAPFAEKVSCFGQQCVMLLFLDKRRGKSTHWENNFHKFIFVYFLQELGGIVGPSTGRIEVLTLKHIIAKKEEKDQTVWRESL